MPFGAFIAAHTVQRDMDIVYPLLREAFREREIFVRQAFCGEKRGVSRAVAVLETIEITSEKCALWEIFRRLSAFEHGDLPVTGVIDLTVERKISRIGGKIL